MLSRKCRTWREEVSVCVFRVGQELHQVGRNTRIQYVFGMRKVRKSVLLFGCRSFAAMSRRGFTACPSRPAEIVTTSIGPRCLANQRRAAQFFLLTTDPSASPGGILQRTRQAVGETTGRLCANPACQNREADKFPDFEACGASLNAFIVARMSARGLASHKLSCKLRPVRWGADMFEPAPNKHFPKFLFVSSPLTLTAETAVEGKVAKKKPREGFGRPEPRICGRRERNSFGSKKRFS